MFPYLGGKANHAQWISPYIPQCSTYCEVFGGAMWLYWQSDKTPVSTNVYNDLNRHLVNVFACASKDRKHYQEVLSTYVYDLGSEEMFNEYRNEVFEIYNNNFIIPDYPLAAKYMVLQLQTFAGNTGLQPTSKIYRSPDKKHKFNIYTEKLNQPKYVKKLSKLTTENLDCFDFIQKYDTADTFLYIDPPYKNHEKYYTQNDFDKHNQLLELLKKTKNAKWALSYYEFDDLKDLLPPDEYVWHKQKTHSMNSTNRGERTELLIMNYNNHSLESLFGADEH
tara:strand:- start:485 stop:1321 length:837 start_codon:yes stop_codon:yes gene_type:complete